MKQTIKVTLEINLKVLNNILALVKEDVITTEEKIQEWGNLILSSDDVDDNDQLLAIGSLALIAKGTMDKKQNKLK